MACRFNVGSGRAFSEHLQDGVTRDQVNEQENNGDDQPDNRKGVRQSQREIPEHFGS